MGIRYEAPEVVDYGSIADHTFLVPGGNVKPPQPFLDVHNEGSHTYPEED